MVKLMKRAEKLRLALKGWLSDHINSDGSPKSDTPLCSGPAKILVLFYLCSIYSNRLNNCIFWTGAPEVDELEKETQKFARILVSLYNEEAYKDLQSSLLLAQKLPIAEATIESGEYWQASLNRRTDASQGQMFVLPKETFEYWCHLFGRTTL